MLVFSSGFMFTDEKNLLVMDGQVFLKISSSSQDALYKIGLWFNVISALDFCPVKEVQTWFNLSLHLHMTFGSEFFFLNGI